MLATSPDVLATSTPTIILTTRGAISTLLIVLRVAHGEAWTAAKAKEMMHEVVSQTAFPMDLRRSPGSNSL